MSQSFMCGDHGALVSYLYDECEPNERLTISAHVAVCSGCAEELTALSATREQLALWRPPDAQLGFRVVSSANSSSNVLRPARWWRQPMPAWAQAAAAVLVFATGLTLGALRGGSAPTLAPAPGIVPTTTAPKAAVTQADLSALEHRLHSEMAQMRSTGETTS